MSTLGCKVNQYESQAVRELLESMGYRPARSGEAADIAVVNTCAVTGEAVRKSRQTIRRLACGGRTEIFVIGCAASLEAESLSRIEGVSAVFGHDVESCHELRRVIPDRSNHVAVGSPSAAGSSPPATECQNGESLGIVGRVIPIVNDAQSLTDRIEQFDGHQRAFLKVQDGCDAHCTYCIIPKLRTSLAWKPVEVALEEARGLVASGHKEIIVTGIFLGAYGRPTALRKRFGRGPSPLVRLVDALARVDGLQRLRLSSLEPGDVDDALLDVMARHEACVPHLHLPLQSGSPDVLHRMNRQYTRDDFVAMIERTQQALRHPAITTDIIVGFPGESDDDFEESVAIAESVPFAKIHAFPFSPRTGTAAARWGGQYVPKDMVKARMARLADVERIGSLAFRRRRLGAVERVLVEGVDGDGPELCNGRSDRYFMVHFEASGLQPGDIVSVRVDRITATRTHGTFLPDGAALPLSVVDAAQV